MMREESADLLGVVDRNQLDFEDKRGIRRHCVASALQAVTELRRNDQLALAADIHGRGSLGPTRDQAIHALHVVESAAVIRRRVEFRAINELAEIIHRDVVAGLDRRAFANDEIDILQPEGVVTMGLPVSLSFSTSAAGVGVGFAAGAFAAGAFVAAGLEKTGLVAPNDSNRPSVPPKIRRREERIGSNFIEGLSKGQSLEKSEKSAIKKDAQAAGASFIAAFQRRA